MVKPTTDQLREAITEIDSMAQGAFSEIATLARMALVSFETPEAYSDIDRIATVLKVILGKALDAENHINCMAEGVACNYKDQAQRRRWDAKRKADESTARGRA